MNDTFSELPVMDVISVGYYDRHGKKILLVDLSVVVVVGVSNSSR
jgi:hypothetical protein